MKRIATISAIALLALSGVYTSCSNNVKTDGTVTPVYAGTMGFISLDGISFPVW